MQPTDKCRAEDRGSSCDIAILTCCQKLTSVSLTCRPQLKSVRTEKLKSKKTGMLRSICKQSGESVESVLWEAIAEKEGFKPGMKEWGGWWNTNNNKYKCQRATRWWWWRWWCNFYTTFSLCCESVIFHRSRKIYQFLTPIHFSRNRGWPMITH